MPHNPKKKTTRRKSERRAIKDDTPEDLAKNESPESVLASSSCLRNDSLETALDSLELSTASSGAPEIIATETHTTIDQQGGKEEKKEREADSISLTASIVNEEEEIKNLDSEEDHELALPDGVEKIPEYTDVLKEDMYSFQIDEPELSRFPDLDRLFSEVIGSIEKNFRPSHVMQELRRFYDLLVQYRQNENNILEKLKSREEELKWLAHKTKRDPRLMKIIQLADGWRQERAEVEKRNVELICQVDLLHGDLRCMEQSTQIMQLNLERMQGELKENEENTSDLKQCQDTAMEREGRLNFLEYSLHHLQSEAKEKQKQHEEALQSLEQCEGELRSMITLETKFRQKEHENRNLVAERDLLKSQVAAHNSNAENSQKRLVVMDRTMTDLKCKLKAFKTNVSHMEVTVKKLNRHLANKRNQCSVLEEEKDRALHDVELLKMKVKEGEDEIKKINTKLKDRNILLHHKERKLKDIKEKLETVEERETVARKETVALNKTICNMERRETTAKREIDLMNTKIINADVRLRKEMTSLTLASSKADSLAKSLDVTLVQLKNCTSRNNSLRAEQLDADSRLKTFQALCDDHVRTIAQGEKNMASLIHNTKKLDQEVTKYRDTVFLLRGKNQVLTADAFSQLETTRILQKHLESTAKEGKSMMKAMDDQEKVLLSLRKAELKARSQLAQLEIENNAQKNTLERAVDQLGIQKTEASNLMMALRKVEEELRSSIVRETALCRDRDIFATRVIQGNIKLELQTIKLRHMEDVIMKGNKDYEDRITDITLLRREIRTLRRKLKLLDNTKYVNSELRAFNVKRYIVRSKSQGYTSKQVARLVTLQGLVVLVTLLQLKTIGSESHACGIGFKQLLKLPEIGVGLNQSATSPFVDA
ncbi:ELKS/Rab6-interacting/CAST family member 1 isoform X2 [Aplysia californica]|uniref:ELKS/Rab6-interacting/CAST family member 1 isoform X2 n=1 Tax=Aplysia californica TaxID=6500 RepID=A0ABM0JM65_APLCA|nr:ELKS/Rab6-interacting/CAST family member 1 isoform X2 [Aplysia californica]